MFKSSLFYDGKTITLYARRANRYATTHAPGSLDAMLDLVNHKLNIEAPAGDLLYSDPYRILMEDVVTGRYLGTSELDGKTCHHLAYEGRAVDWQLWIRAGDHPLPCKYVITSKDVKSRPEYAVEFHDWNEKAYVSADRFEFNPPPNARRVDLKSLQEGGKRMAMQEMTK